jgi:23S rRNA (adenine2503-C2)-methyltransferase
MKVLKVPTGKIMIIDGEYGLLECLSLADYGKEKNVKASFMGLNKDIEGVKHNDLMPLSKKWVITLSSQYGCSMGCKFCDVPLVGVGRNASIRDMNKQLLTSIAIENCFKTERLNIHYARMGEPTFNYDIIEHAENLIDVVSPLIKTDVIHPVISTMMPRKNKNLEEFLWQWTGIKNNVYKGDAGLQLSINSTDDQQRKIMFSGSSLSLSMISKLTRMLPKPKGRKYCLNFAIADNTIIESDKLATLFSPEHFMVKITPIHKTCNTVKNHINLNKGYIKYTPYKNHEENLKKSGFDVLVFIPSIEEDRGLITCGNAILSGRKPETKYDIFEIN